MTRGNKLCSSWTLLVSFLLLGVMASILTGGVNTYLLYKKAVDPDLSFNLSVLNLFTKEYLERRYLSLRVSPQPEKSSVASFHLYSDENSLEILDSDLPASGKTQFVNGHIQLQNPDKSSGVQFRYRGGLPLHWLYKKKSYRIKLPPFNTYRGERQFNLVNPSTIHTITDWISYEIAQSLGILTPEYFPVRLFVNNSTNGLHFFLSRADESFLRKNKRMPGSIYSGDTKYVLNPFGKNMDGMSETTFTDDKGISLMWTDERLWDKDASRNSEAEKDRSDIQKFIEIINLQNPLLFFQ